MKKNKFYIFSFLLLVLCSLILPFSYVSASVLTPGRFVQHDYDSSVSIFDKYGNDIILMSNCDSTYYFDSSNNSISVNSGKKICDSSHGVSLDNIKKYFKYYIHVSYQDEVDGSEYDTYLVFVNQPYLKIYQKDGYTKGVLTDSFGNVNGLQGMVLLNHYGYTSIHLVSDSSLSDFRAGFSGINGNAYSGKTYLNGFIDWYGTNPEHNSFSFSNHHNFDIYNLVNYHSDYTSISVHSNFDLMYLNSDDIYVAGSNGFIFNTDSDITVPSHSYLLLLPKKNTAFTSYLWTDTNFLYQYSESDCISSYNEVSGGGFDEISFGALNGFNWFRWDFTFSSADINNHRILQLYNHSSSDLHIKFFSDDFDYYLMKENSGSVSYNSCIYNNNWNTLNEIASHHVINNSYSVDTFNDGMDFLNSLPNLISSFSKSFIFIGDCVSSFFLLCSDEMQIYFYLIFGLLIIISIISVLKQEVYMVGIFESIFSIINFIATLISFIGSMVSIILTLGAVFFTSLPSYISVGYFCIFGLGMIILIIKMYKQEVYMYDLFYDLIGTLPLRYQFIIPITIMVLIFLLLCFIFKLLGGRF